MVKCIHVSTARYIVRERERGTHIIKYNAYKDIKWNPEKVHNCTSCFFRNILRPHFHNRWPK